MQSIGAPAVSPGTRVFGAGAIALGLVGLAWGDFSAPWQPVPDDFPARIALAYAAAAMLLGSGLALQSSKAPRGTALVSALLYALFALPWAIRVAGAPQVFGTWLGFAEQLALALGGVALFALRTGQAQLALIARLGFGVCLVAFGVAHWIYVKETAAMVPAWLPPGTSFWAVATGAFHALAGLALLSGIGALLAARLAGAMFLGFGLLVWLPQLWPQPAAHMAWGGNAINLALVGAAWAVADAIAGFGSGWPLRRAASASFR